MNNLLYYSKEFDLGVNIDRQLIKYLFKECGKAHPYETGGILLGKYSTDHKTAKILLVTKETTDSIGNSVKFYRGIAGLQCLIDKLWMEQGIFYLGEWHYHPLGEPTPSKQDIKEMVRIMKNDKYNCPEPVLIVVGHKFIEKAIGIYVFLEDDELIPLQLIV